MPNSEHYDIAGELYPFSSSQEQYQQSAEDEGSETIRRTIQDRQRARKRVDSKDLFGAIRGGGNQIPLSILDNIDTIRRGLMRELIMRRREQEMLDRMRSSEEFKNLVGKRKK